VLSCFVAVLASVLVRVPHDTLNEWFLLSIVRISVIAPVTSLTDGRLLAFRSF
jgi:hypothetical protein